MEFSLKQCAAVLLAIMMFSLSLQSLFTQLEKQGGDMKKATKVSYIDHQSQLTTNGNVIDSTHKPVVKRAIFHMRRGDYRNFSYSSLLDVESIGGSGIQVEGDTTIQGIIEGHQRGANILYCCVYDSVGNYIRYKLVVLIEGEDNINTAINNYSEGILV